MSTPAQNKLAEKLAEVRQRTAAASGDAAPAADVPAAPAALPPAPPRRVAPVPYRRRAAEPSWDERVKRATFYIDRSLLDELDQVCAKHGLNKSEFVREAVQRHLKRLRKR